MRRMLIPHHAEVVCVRCTADGDPVLREQGLPTTGAKINSCLRSEEHTSELQSQSNLVCRLLLEKKKKLHVGQHLYPQPLFYCPVILFRLHRLQRLFVGNSRTRQLPDPTFSRVGPAAMHTHH